MVRVGETEGAASGVWLGWWRVRERRGTAKLQKTNAASRRSDLDWFRTPSARVFLVLCRVRAHKL